MYWVLGPDGQRYGPADTATLQQWQQEGRLLPSTRLVRVDSGAETFASSTPGLRHLFGDQFSAPGFAPAAPVNYYTRQIPDVKSAKSKVVAILLALFLGSIGVHRFYLGHIGSGIAMLVLCFVTCGILTPIWALVDVILIATDSLRDADGTRLS